MSFHSEVSTPSGCYSERLALAIPANIRRLKNYVANLDPDGTLDAYSFVPFNYLKRNVFFY